MPQTNVDDFIEELNAGIFKEKLAHTLSDAALGVVINGNGVKKAKVKIEFTLSQVGDNEQVLIAHKLAHEIPTKRGKRAEEDITETSMFVGKGGVMTIDTPKEDNNGQFQLEQDDDGIRRIK
ncbi:hypothetical protein A3765_28385 [Oleiphilus sp. HI0130]|nr:hypothetical protein A3765_28695 [Oleiphilus sp. HI0130]KZZ72470.1 hypothetical protein A3765_28385 [Oleiphilus sp. HI0130]